MANLHGMYNAGTMYSAGNNGWSGPQNELFYSKALGVSAIPWGAPADAEPWAGPIPPVIASRTLEPWASYPINIPSFTPLDHFYAMQLVTGTVDRTHKRALDGGLKHYLVDVDLAMCPLARTMFPNPAGLYWGAYGWLRGSYSYSQLMLEWPYGTPGPSGARTRDNAYGPYKSEELSDSSNTMWMCDGLAMTDVGAARWQTIAVDPNGNPVGSPVSVDVGYVRNFRYYQVALTGGTCPYRLFGAITNSVDYYAGSTSQTVYNQWDYYHQQPAAVHWDGHVGSYSPPGDDDVQAILKHLTRDGTNKPL
jgi:3D (Asp-Asp-Asp) domain-containing protein